MSERTERRGAVCGVGGFVLLIATVASAAPSTPPSLATSKVVDLSHPFDEKTLYWPTSPSSFELKKLSFGDTPGGWFYASNSICTPEHGGTHLDAPIHFSKDGKTIDQIPLRQLIAPAVLIDVSAKASADPDYRLSMDDVRSWEKRHGTIPSGAIVLLRTGWAKRWPDRKQYLGDDTPGDASKLHFPSFGKESAEYLVGQRHVGVLGLDTASIEVGAYKEAETWASEFGGRACATAAWSRCTPPGRLRSRQASSSSGACARNAPRSTIRSAQSGARVTASSAVTWAIRGRI